MRGFCQGLDLRLVARRGPFSFPDIRGGPAGRDPQVVAYLRDSRTGELRREHPEDGPPEGDEAPVSLKEGKWVF